MTKSEPKYEYQEEEHGSGSIEIENLAARFAPPDRSNLSNEQRLTIVRATAIASARMFFASFILIISMFFASSIYSTKLNHEYKMMQLELEQTFRIQSLAAVPLDEPQASVTVTPPENLE